MLTHMFYVEIVFVTRFTGGLSFLQVYVAKNSSLCSFLHVLFVLKYCDIVSIKYDLSCLDT